MSICVNSGGWGCAAKMMRFLPVWCFLMATVLPVLTRLTSMLCPTSGMFRYLLWSCAVQTCPDQ